MDTILDLPEKGCYFLYSWIYQEFLTILFLANSFLPQWIRETTNTQKQRQNDYQCAPFIRLHSMRAELHEELMVTSRNYRSTQRIVHASQWQFHLFAICIYNIQVPIIWIVNLWEYCHLIALVHRFICDTIDGIWYNADSIDIVCPQ